jgi:DHA1 family tetracycline resistance protein-like MFS transporter
MAPAPANETPPQTGSARPPRKGAMAFILATVALDMISVGMIVPVLPKIVATFFPNDAVATAHAFGQVMTIWALLQFFMSPILGALSDQFGRRPVILVSCLGLGASFFMTAWATSFTALIVARLVSGATAGNVSACNAYVADIVPPEGRAKAFGLIGAAFGAGFTLGPALGGLLGEIDVRLPFQVAGVLCLLNALYGLFILPESLPRGLRRPFSWRKANPIGALMVFRAQPMLWALIPVYALFALAQNVFPSSFVLYAGHRYGFGPQMAGATMAASATLSILAQVFLVQRIVKALRERRSVMLALGLGGCGFALYGLAPTPWLFWASMPVMTLWALFMPSAQSLMTRRVSPDAQGQLQGGLGSLMALTGVIAPSLFTGLFAWGIAAEGPGGGGVPGAPFLAASAFAFAGCLITFLAVRKSPGSGPPE